MEYDSLPLDSALKNQDAIYWVQINILIDCHELEFGFVPNLVQA